jgi:hypothetical protein
MCRAKQKAKQTRVCEKLIHGHMTCMFIVLAIEVDLEANQSRSQLAFIMTTFLW